MSDELEQLIANQRLRKPSVMLDGRVAGTLGKPRTSRLWVYVGAVTGMAACVTMVAGLLRNPGPSSPGGVSGTFSAAEKVPDTFVRVDQVWSQVTPGDLLLTDDKEPVRPMRVQRIYHTQWIDEKDNVKIEMTGPDDQVVLVSAPIQ